MVATTQPVAARRTERAEERTIADESLIRQLVFLEARCKQRNSHNVVTCQNIPRHLVCIVRVTAVVYPRRLGELHVLLAQLTVVNYVFPDVGQLAPLFERERTEAATVSKSKVSDAPDALRNRYLPEITVKEAAPADFLQS